MPAFARCIHCRKGIDLEAEIFVVVNKGREADPRWWRYAHAECHPAEAPTAAAWARPGAPGCEGGPSHEA